MAFVLSNKPTFWFRVEVKRPDDKGGWASFTFQAEFRRRTRPEIDDMIKAGALQKGDDDLLGTELVGWKDVSDAEGKPLEVNAANCTLLLAEPHVQSAIARAWLEASITGPAKN